MRNTLASLIVVLSVAGLAACGSSDGPPQPLKRHFEDSYIAGISVDEQGDVVTAQSAYNVAQREQAKAEADLRESKTQLDIAKNEARAARLDMDSAASRLKAAEQSADRNRINDATRDKRGAELARSAADERVKYYQAYQEWLKKLLRYTQENTYWKESQYELAKARLAQKHNIAPAGFNFDNYTQQEHHRAERVQGAKSKAETHKEKAMNARQRWLALQTESDKLLGKKSQFPDPLAPRPVQGTDPTQGAGGATLGGSDASSDDQLEPADDPVGDGE